MADRRTRSNSEANRAGRPRTAVIENPKPKKLTEKFITALTDLPEFTGPVEVVKYEWWVQIKKDYIIPEMHSWDRRLILKWQNQINPDLLPVRIETVFLPHLCKTTKEKKNVVRTADSEVSRSQPES